MKALSMVKMGLLYLVQSVARDVHDSRQGQAPRVVIAAHLPALLQPSPHDVPALHANSSSQSLPYAIASRR